MSNPLIFGKNPLEKIVSIEVGDDGVAEIFTEYNGTVKTTIIDTQYWILGSQNFDGNWNRLQGDLYYRFGKQFTTKEEWSKERTNLKRKHDDKTYSIWNLEEALMVKDGYSYFKGLTPKQVSTLSFDIETTGLDPKARDAKVLIITNTYRDKTGKVYRKLFTYDNYQNEAELINAWCKWVRTEADPSIIIGHNIFGFDIPYLHTRASYNSTSLVLGRDGSDLKIEGYENKFRVDGSRDLHFHDAKIYGRSLVDTMFLSVKADLGRKYDSYGLKAIIKQEGWEVENRQHYDAGTIRDHYKNPTEWEKIKKYAEFDGDDALKLYDEFIPPFFEIAKSTPKTFQNVMQSASGSQLNSIMMRSYLQEGHSLPKTTQSLDFQGAISFGIPGIYKNAVRFDFASMYPSIMLEYKIGLGDKDPKQNFLHILEYFTKERLLNKKLYKETKNVFYKHLEQTAKVWINSAYGFMGAPGLLFNNTANAAKVTEKGRELLGTCIKWASSRDISSYI